MNPTHAPALIRTEGVRAGTWARMARAALERRMTGLAHGSVTLHETWNDRKVTFGRPEGPAVTLRVHDPRFYTEVVRGGSIGAGESYSDGHWSCEDLPGLVAILVRNRSVLDGLESGLARLAVPVRKLMHALRRNSREGSRRNIAAHYDLGNDFFALFLDETMTYSCAVFERDEMSLAEASTAKLDRLCRKLELRPGDRLLEIGCGWGSMALHAARHYGCEVTTTTISPSQHAMAVERVRAAGLQDRVTVLLQDYRDLQGTWDKLVSVEMIEAVGAEHLDTYLEACGRLLTPDGLFALQAITIQDQHYDRARREVDFIKRHVFPGSFIPCVTAITGAATRRTEMRLVHLEDMGSHYTRTLATWRENLRARWDEARSLGYEDEFLRAWEYYLAYCEGGFAERFLGVSQMLFAAPHARRDPLMPPLPAPASGR